MCWKTCLDINLEYSFWYLDIIQYLSRPLYTKTKITFSISIFYPNRWSLLCQNEFVKLTSIKKSLQDFNNLIFMIKANVLITVILHVRDFLAKLIILFTIFYQIIWIVIISFIWFPQEFNKNSNSLYTILRSSRIAGSQRAPFLRRFLLRLNFNSFFEVNWKCHTQSSPSQ